MCNVAETKRLLVKKISQVIFFCLLFHVGEVGWMEKRIGVVGIVVESKENVPRLNSILSEFGENIIGRMGVPVKHSKGISVISLIVEGTTDEIGSLTGKLGNLSGITVKTALTKVSID